MQEQHIAVFGGSGSGKTVLVSSFYGAAQEDAFLKESLFHVIADDAGKGSRLLQSYLRMKNSSTVPDDTRFDATPYSFTIKMKDKCDAKLAKGKPFDALRLVWHDYPGQWFEEEPSSEAEAKRRIDTFRLLLRSNVAVVLVDGQKLLDYAGKEEKYLNFVFMTFTARLLQLKGDLLDDGKPLDRFPRIWVIALSKADLHPGLDVHGFHDLVIQKAAGAVSSLREVLKGLVQLPEALSLGEDFMLLSSAKFEPGKIEVTERVGVDLLLPVACLLPLEHLVHLEEKFEIPHKLLGHLADNADALAAILIGATPLTALLNKVPGIGPLLAKVALPGLAAAVKLGEPMIKKTFAEALAKKDYLTATLTQFQLQLYQGEEDHLLFTSPK